MGLMSSLPGCRISKHSPDIAPAPHSLTRYSGSQPPLSFADTKALCLAQGLCQFLALHQSGFLSYITSSQQLPWRAQPNFLHQVYPLLRHLHHLSLPEISLHIYVCLFFYMFTSVSPMPNLTFPDLSTKKSRKNHNSDKLKLE